MGTSGLGIHDLAFALALALTLIISGLAYPGIRVSHPFPVQESAFLRLVSLVTPVSSVSVSTSTSTSYQQRQRQQQQFIVLNFQVFQF